MTRNFRLRSPGVVEPPVRRRRTRRQALPRRLTTAIAVPIRIPAKLVAELQAQGGRDGTAGVARHEQVVLALRRVGVAHEAPLGADAVELLVPAGDQLVRIDLVAGIPDEPILAEVVDEVQCQAQLDDAEVGSEVRGPDREDADELVSISCGKLGELFGREIVKILWAIDTRQDRTHETSPGGPSRIRGEVFVRRPGNPFVRP